jgi:hypothetical protein
MYTQTKAFFVNGELVKKPDGTYYLKTKTCDLEQVIKELGTSKVSFGVTTPKNSKNPDSERVIVIKEVSGQSQNIHQSSSNRYEQKNSVPLV